MTTYNRMTIEDLLTKYTKPQLLQIFRWCRLHDVQVLTPQELDTIVALSPDDPALQEKMLKLPKGENTPVSANFKAKEFDCKCSGLCNLTEIHVDLIAKLQHVRDAFGEPIHITSAYRCPTHNTQVGGVSDSTHTTGSAVDLTCSDLDRLAHTIETLYPECSIGRYDTFVHFDIRRKSARWDKRTSHT